MSMQCDVGQEATVVMTATDDELREALRFANLPTLLLVVAQLSGDDRWLQDPFRPTRTVGMNDNDTAGLPPGRQEEIREAGFELLRKWRDGRLSLPEPPDAARIIELLTVSLGEAVPPEFGPAMAQEAGFVERQVGWPGEAPAAAGNFRVVVIGAGFSGLCAGITLDRLGIPYVIIDKNTDVGGTWLENGYPGAAVDTPSHLYSFSFRPNRGWSRYYAKQPDILAYLRASADELGLRPHIRFNTEVVAARYDETRCEWEIDVRGGGGASNGTERLRANVVISGVGQLNRPNVPTIPGLDRFRGPVFHSARWRHDVTLAGRRVAVVGTGASAMQIVPAIAGDAGRILIFQRSPQWVMPNPNYLRDVDDRTRLLMEQVPYYATWYRLRLIHQFQDKLHPVLQKDPAWPHPERAVNAQNDRHREIFVEHIREQIAGHEAKLAGKVLPSYPPYGKRILMDNRWYRTLCRDDVQLIDQGVTGFDETAVITADGDRYDVDVVVLATGFHSRRLLYPMDIRGRGGVSLREAWGDDDARAYLGITVPGFPNLFLMYGPNTNLGHGGSTVFNAECQAGYIGQVLVEMISRGLASVEVRQVACDAYNQRVDDAHDKMIWTHPGMTTWYRNAKGRVVTNTPWRSVDYWWMTRYANLDDFVLVPRAGRNIDAGSECCLTVEETA